MTALETSIEVFGWLTVIITVSLSLPQLFKLLKEKKTQKVNFYSFWIFHIGILMWTIFGVLSDSSQPFKLRNIVIADGISLILNGVMTYLLYHYYDFSSYKNKRTFLSNSQNQEMYIKTSNHTGKKVWAFLGVLATWVIGIVFIVIYFTNSAFRISSNAATIFAIIAPALTTFSFAPQLYTSIKTKNWKGVSPMMFVLFELNNLCWIAFWVLSIVKYGGNLDLIGGLIWQTVSLILYAYQLTMTIKYNYTAASKQPVYA
ncbi:PQ-loop domain-containing transporter [Mycoplasmopsis columboralis]|uniref:PQ loop repeat n=1 Tax=Mycoplasmopsis columboralis TaxID=171282 RepID=A0A449B6X8_9BACT|nr:PQ-loop domain-containing transporter [Mycoplasmopsis columboralis]VEU76366.1 PQ loop repeat [Mycoplasmopsis columboralis]